MSNIERKYVTSIFDNPVYFQARDITVDDERRTLCEFIITRTDKHAIILPVVPPFKVSLHETGSVPLTPDGKVDGTVQITDEDIRILTSEYKDQFAAAALSDAWEPK